MPPDTVQGITQATPQISDAKPGQSQQAENSVVSQSAVANTGNATPAVDIVNISAQSRQAAVGEVKKDITAEVVKKENARKEEANARMSGNVFEQAPSKVQFVYDQKGDLIVKYMDTSNRLVYQIPSKLTIIQRDLASKTAVDNHA